VVWEGSKDNYPDSAAEVSCGMDVPGLKDVAGFVAEHDEAA
jgi:hypothetical protein